jgi:acetate kinase
MSILVLNAGSSTLKFTLFEQPGLGECAGGVISLAAAGQQASVSFQVGGKDQAPPACAIADFHAAVTRMVDLLRPVPQMQQVRACGHRVVHGGVRFRQSVPIDAEVKNAIRQLAELAPLHNPPALAGIEAVETALPGLAQVAAFDTAFFAEQPEVSYHYAVPHAWYEDWGVRRFGFHGISHHFCTTRVHELVPDRPELRIVSCHLGNGCSASAVHGRQAITSTMGYTPLEGLMMGTRSGSLDPGILLHLLKHRLLTTEQLDRALNHEAGLLGVSGVSSDFRAVQKAAESGHERARLALDMYTTRVRATIGSLAATLGGIDVLVFTAGVGEHSAWLRQKACDGLQFLGVVIDRARNEKAKADVDIAADHSAARILVLHTREELLIARDTEQIVNREGNS